MTDADSHTVLVTGATSGIGAKAAVDLATRGWRVFVHGRDRSRGEAVVERARRASASDNVEFLRADFADRSAVRGLAETVRERTSRLDALVHNAGLSRGSCRLAWDGVEETFAVNQLAPYLLTHDLATLLVDSSARVVVTASAVHERGELDFEDPTALVCAGSYDALAAYARSKLANVLFALELADRFAGSAVTANALHPGFVPGSRLYRHTGLLFRAAITLSRYVPFVGTAVEEGAEGIVYLVDSPEVEETTGAYFHGREREEPDPRVHDADRRERLWNLCADLADVSPDWPDV